MDVRRKIRLDPEMLDAPLRMFRGGCWFYYGEFCESSHHYNYDPGRAFDGVGLRLTLSPEEPTDAISTT